MPRGAGRSQIRIVQRGVCRTGYGCQRRTGQPDQGSPVGGLRNLCQAGDFLVGKSPENSAEGIVNLLKKGRFIYVEAYDKVEAWLDKENKPRARVIYRVTNFQV